MAKNQPNKRERLGAFGDPDRCLDFFGYFDAAFEDENYEINRLGMK